MVVGDTDPHTEKNVFLLSAAVGKNRLAVAGRNVHLFLKVGHHPAPLGVFSNGHTTGHYHGSPPDVQAALVLSDAKRDGTRVFLQKGEGTVKDKEQAGIRKQSFELYYNGGAIWCEHLDSMGNQEEEIIRKCRQDSKTFRRPSVSSYMIVNLDETTLTVPIADCIIDCVGSGPKRFMKIALVGVEKKQHKFFNRLKKAGIVIAFFEDYEKAKEWLF